MAMMQNGRPPMPPDGGPGGLMNQGGGGSSAPPGRRDAMTAGEGAPMDDGEQPNVSPEEQAAYNQFVTKGFELIYDEKVMPQILGMLGSDGDPKEGLANATATVVMRLEDSAKQAGREIPPDVRLHGGKELLEDLANLASEAGVHEFTEDEMEGAAYRALDIYREVRQSQGELDEGPIRQDFEQIVAADRAGQLEQMMPGLASHFGGAGGGQQQRPPSRGNRREEMA